nr:hypothetical protein [Paracoccus sp. (in: a-proteobacteria)]
MATRKTTASFSLSSVDFSVITGETGSRHSGRASMVFALAIAAGLQLFDRRAGQDQRVGTDHAVDIGPDRRQRIDADDVKAEA